jgi:hypothetical protein
MLALVLLAERQASARFPRGPAFGSEGGVGQGAKDSPGNRLGPAGKKIGPGPWRGALAAAARLF